MSPIPVFTPPADLIVPTVNAKHHPMNRLYGHYRLGPRGRNVYKLADGTYAEQIVQDQGTASIVSDNGSGAPGQRVVKTYWGSTGNLVTAAEQTALLAAGYATSNFTAFDPRVVPGLMAWWDASQITGLSDTDPVSTWQSVNEPAFTFTSSGTARPLYRTNIANSHPVVRFDGVNDFMTTRWPFEVTVPATVMFVASRSNAAATQVLLDGFSPNGLESRGFAFFGTTTTITSRGFGGNDGSATADANFTAGSFSLAVWTLTFPEAQNWTNTVQLRRNGSSVLTSTTLTAANLAALKVSPVRGTGWTLGSFLNGAALFWPGDVAELVLFEGIPDAATISQLEADLQGKYGL